MLHVRHSLIGFYTCISVALIAGSFSLAASAPIEESSEPYQFSSSIEPLPQSIKLDQDKVKLGQILFGDKRLSRNNAVSCASCHDVNTNGADTLPHSVGWSGKFSTMNTPTVFNSGYNDVQFWDGRAGSLEEQVDHPIHNPLEMGTTWKAILRKLNKDNSLKTQFSKIYHGDITSDAIKNALATYERSLITPNSKFDLFLRGDPTAINTIEKKGYALFQSLGCIACHQGKNVGGNLFQRLGIFEDYFTDKNPKKSDLGRYNITFDQRDYYVFKVPSLRNIALTAPYLHDGSAETLEKVVQIMAQYQLGFTISDEDTQNIVAFLNTLTGVKNWKTP